MDKEIKDLLENEVLGDDARTALQEAFNNKVKLAEQKLQEHYAERYSKDKATLVEAMDKMLSDVIKTEFDEFAEDRSALIKQRAKLSEKTANVKKAYAKKLFEQVKHINSFVEKHVRQEVKEFANDRATLQEQRKEMARELQALREQTQNDMDNRINKLETFVLKKLSEEVAEFSTDKKALVEQRVKLAEQGKKQIHEAKIAFIDRVGKSVDKTLNEVIGKELKQWKDDIKAARENNFGRRIFEAVAAEYMASYLSEGSEVKKLMNELQKKSADLAKANAIIKESTKLLESAKTEAKFANDRVKRTETLTSLLSPLNRDKRAIMEDLLKDVKTSNLYEAFNKYLPAVVHGSKSDEGKKQLTESSKKSTTVAVTGDRKQPAMITEDENKQPEGLGEILHLAGIKN